MLASGQDVNIHVLDTETFSTDDCFSSGNK